MRAALFSRSGKRQNNSQCFSYRKLQLESGTQNNSRNHGLLIYNKVGKTASTFVMRIMVQLAKHNKFSHIHVPQKHYFNTSMSGELSFLWHHYKSPWPYSTDQHIMFVNTVEHYGLSEDERPNWFNIVRNPVQRLVSHYYFVQKMNPSTANQVRFSINHGGLFRLFHAHENPNWAQKMINNSKWFCGEKMREIAS